MARAEQWDALAQEQDDLTQCTRIRVLPECVEKVVIGCATAERS